MATYEAAAAFNIASEMGTTTEDLESTPMSVYFAEVREPLWIRLTEVTN